MANKLIGRKEEIDLLSKYCGTDNNEMVAVYGRRRVGKTFLVRQTLGDLFDFSFVGMYKQTAKTQTNGKKWNSCRGWYNKR